MIRRVATYLAAFVFALGVLFISVFRTAAVKYDFAGPVNGSEGKVLGEAASRIPYELAYSGKILPDSPLWPLKALRDRVWLLVTTNPGRKAEILLLFADKRLSAAKVLFEKGDFETGFSTLTKAEKYLEEACAQEIANRQDGIDTSEFLKRLSFASLKHVEVIDEIYQNAPEDAMPKMIEVRDAYPLKVYEKTMHALNEKGMDVPENPFIGE